MTDSIKNIIAETRDGLAIKVLNHPSATTQQIEQWCVQARDHLVTAEVPVSQADKEILSVMVGKVSINDFRLLTSFLELTDPPEPKWKSASKNQLLIAAKDIWQNHPNEKPNTEELEELTSVFTDSTRVMIQHGVPRRVAVADLTDVLAENLPPRYVDDLMLEIQMRSLGRRVRGSDPAPV